MQNDSSKKPSQTQPTKLSLRQRLGHLLLRIPSHLLPLAEQLSKAAMHGVIDRQHDAKQQSQRKDDGDGRLAVQAHERQHR